MINESWLDVPDLNVPSKSMLVNIIPNFLNLLMHTPIKNLAIERNTPIMAIERYIQLTEKLAHADRTCHIYYRVCAILNEQIPQINQFSLLKLMTFFLPDYYAL